MGYKSVAQIAEQWGISDRRVRILCQQGKIDGVIRKGRTWLIPADAEKPIDGRTTRYQRNDSPYVELFAEVDALKAELDKRRPLTQGELQRLRDEFLIEYTYNSNAIEGNTLTLRETDFVLRGLTIDETAGWHLHQDKQSRRTARPLRAPYSLREDSLRTKTSAA